MLNMFISITHFCIDKKYGFVVLVTMISLIVSMGAPVSWMRLSFIGSVNYEAMAAGFGAQAMGATLENLTPVAFACGVWTMICGSLGWLIFTLLFTDKMDKVKRMLMTILTSGIATILSFLINGGD